MTYWNIMNLAFTLSNLAYNHYTNLEADLWERYGGDYDAEPPREYWDVVDRKREASTACDEVMALYLKG